MLQKSYIAKLYAPDGSTLRRNITTQKPLDPALPYLKSSPAFTSRINGGQGECVLDIALPFDSFDEGNSVDFMNVVDIWCYDSAHTLGRRIYRGFISRYEPYIENSSEGVRVTLLGLVSLLTFSYYKDGDYTVTHTAEDPGAIARAIIDHVNSVYSAGLLSYDDISTDAVGANVDVEFEDQKWFDAIQKAHELAGTGWWWFIGADGVFWFQAKPAQATHAFTIGKDIDSLVCPKDSEKVINDVQVRWSSGNEPFDDAISQGEFGKRSSLISASDLTSLTAAQQRGQKEVNDNKDEKIKATLVINNAYDLESIKPGDTCNVRNVRIENSFFVDNLQIASVSYQGDRCTLELEEESANFGLELQSFVER